ncbi:uncharacterized protein LOC111338206 [Stylophora pistillata]|uniref:uncharacterized protein LOC111338206 n=1 Tax=Stylophora pistillata TaxID=50429 RepID=UPI000C03AC0F|nr:uncharacterized protein LOC111338206 [Stylophora pistillata]
MLLFYMAFASMASMAVMGKALISEKVISYPRSNRTASTMRKKSYPGSFRSLSSTSRLASPPASSPHSHRSINKTRPSNERTHAGNPATSTLRFHCFSYPGAPAMDRSEIFEIKGKSFKSDGCWRDNRDRAIEKLEGKHPLLKESDYRSRVNALMKCAEVALAKNLPMFALQNGGQCFGGIDTGKTFRKYGPSAACCDGNAKGGRR